MSSENDALIEEGRSATKTIGLVFSVLGIIMMLFPTATTVGLALYVGAMMLIAGALSLMLGWKTQQENGWGPVVGGSLLAVVGLIVVLNPQQSAVAMTALITFFLVIDGAIGSVMALVRRAHGWGFLLFASLVSLVLGVMLWQHLPTSATWLFGTFVGIVLLVRGLAYLYMSHVINKMQDSLAPAA